MSQEKQLLFWRLLVNFWGYLTLLFFIADFLINDSYFNASLSSLSLVYASILAIYVGTKEFTRWTSKSYPSQHWGEIFIILWTTLMVIFIFVAAFQPAYQIPSEFTATYITIMGIFAISQKSKSLKKYN